MFCSMLSDKEYQKSMGRPPRWKRLMQDADDKDPKRYVLLHNFVFSKLILAVCQLRLLQEDS